jgi:transaldolase
VRRLLFASTGTKDPAASDTLDASGLATPHTVNTMPEDTLLAFADHGVMGNPLDADPAMAAVLVARFTAAGIDSEAVGHEIQVKGADAIVASWTSLLDRIGAKVGEVPAGA